MVLGYHHFRKPPKVYIRTLIKIMYLQLLGPAPQILTLNGGDLLGEEPRAEKPLGESTTTGISVLLTSFCQVPETLNNLGEKDGTQPPHFGDARDITLTNKVEKDQLLPWHPPQSQQDTMDIPESNLIDLHHCTSRADSPPTPQWQSHFSTPNMTKRTFVFMDMLMKTCGNGSIR